MLSVTLMVLEKVLKSGVNESVGTVNVLWYRIHQAGNLTLTETLDFLLAYSAFEPGHVCESHFKLQLKYRNLDLFGIQALPLFLGWSFRLGSCCGALVYHIGAFSSLSLYSFLAQLLVFLQSGGSWSCVIHICPLDQQFGSISPNFLFFFGDFFILTLGLWIFDLLCCTYCNFWPHGSGGFISFYIYLGKHQL